MEIAILVLVIIMFLFSLGAIICIVSFAYKGKKQKTKKSEINIQKNKEILSTSRSSKECANAGWEIVSNNATVFTVNTRKSKYSDERESHHFSQNLTDKRLALLNQIDGECEYGRY
ncbi:MAG: hypothetical protein J1F65_06340 [Clostridiales bacterium]|nr:hypothetical protein [Clostridiales bacterium]